MEINRIRNDKTHDDEFQQSIEIIQRMIVEGDQEDCKHDCSRYSHIKFHKLKSTITGEEEKLTFS